MVTDKQIYRININWHPEFNIRPNWKTYTREDFCDRHNLTEDDWLQMIEAGAVIKLTQRSE